MSLVSKLLLKICEPAWQLRCSGFVPSNSEHFTRDRRQQVKTAIRYLKRLLYMKLRGQKPLLLDHIPSDAQRILWINVTAPSLGDALMDTSGRVLLRERQVVLMTDPKNAELFNTEDPFFSEVLRADSDGVRQASKSTFDLIILDSFSPSSLKLKIRAAKKTPFVGLYGFLNGYEVHRIFYSFRRLERLLTLPPDAIPRLSVGVANSQIQHIRIPARIAIAVGGEWSFRTYLNWGPVVSTLLQMGHSIVLLGSENGRGIADALTRDFGDSILNLVGKTTLNSAVASLMDCEFFVGADGGLWHVASARGLPSVSLHADCQLYDEMGAWHSRAGAEPPCVPIRAVRNVNEITPEMVLNAVQTLKLRLRS
jgi:hypothetical protein